MAVSGDASQWGDTFPQWLIPDVLDLVLTTWRDFKKPAPLDLEVSITRRFRECLCKRQEFRRLPFTVWPESTETDPDTADEKGRIDLRFLHGYRKGVYFAFECKRLCVPYPTGMKTGASAYVGDKGMMRFVTGKYSAGLDVGGMIGYVMDGQVDVAIEAVRGLIRKKRSALRMASSKGMVASRIMPKDIILPKNWTTA